MPNIFQKVAVRKPKRSKFDLSHDVKLSTKMGRLTPVCCLEAVPGDKFRINAQALVRFAPMIAPLMHRVNVTVHYFFVPNRILWDNWENFITKTPVGSPAIVPPLPFFYANPSDPSIQEESLYDYLGGPLGTTPTGSQLKMSLLPFAAYQKIYNEYYRAQQIQTEIDTTLNDGDMSAAPNIAALKSLRRRGWQHDYFTSALPFAQFGDAVEVPLGDIRLKEDWFDNGQTPVWDVHLEDGEHFDDFKPNDVAGDSGFPSTSPASDPFELGGEYRVIPGTPDDPARRAAYDPNGSLESAPVTINELRRAESLQTFLELLARGGSRYVEYIRNFFNVKPEDFRLQRPEYICGVKSPVQISEVLNTTGNEGQLPQGNMAGHGAGVVSSKAGSYFCKEHGYLIGIMSVMPETAYQQGLPKHFSKFDPLDYFVPQFEGLGEQEIKMKEIYARFSSSNDEEVFGYTPRHAEYKYQPNRVAGNFRNTQSYWHLGRIFNSAPALNSSFIACTPRNDIFAVEDPDVSNLYCHVANNIIASRPMQKFTIPTL